jgi:trimeric autotransporter adhesin
MLRTRGWAAWCAGVAVMWLSLSAHAAMPAAGAMIRNQAVATFRACLDDTCATVSDEQRVSSNIVQTLVQAVPGIDLVSGQQRIGQPGGRVLFAHVLTNTGNDSDRYQLCINNVAPQISAWQLYADDNSDGQPDSLIPLMDQTDADGCLDTPTALLAAGDSLQVVIAADIAPSASTGTSAALTVQARSEANNALVASNTNQIALVNGPVIDVVKKIDSPYARSPGGPLTVTLTWQNTGTETATDVVIEDILPLQSVAGVNAGLQYVPGSARWSSTGALVLTDDGDDGAQGTAPLTMDFCAYDTGAVEVRCQDRVRAVISRVTPGATASLTFAVTVAPGLQDGDRLLNTARYFYRNAAGDLSFGEPVPFDSNTVALRIRSSAQTPGVVANNDNGDSNPGTDDLSDSGNIVSHAAVGQGAQLTFSGVIWNTGDGEDRFDLRVFTNQNRTGGALADPFPAGTAFMLLRADGYTPLTDTNGNGLPDTGPLPRPDSNGLCPARFVVNSAGDACGLVVSVLVSLPPDAVGGPRHATLAASSVTDETVRNAVTLRLADIVASTVDITNDRAADGSAPGEGAGPEAAPVTVVPITPGGSAMLVLVVNNRGSVQDNFDLSVSGSDFIPGQLPAGWQVQLLSDAGAGNCSATSAVLSNTGLIPGGQSRVVCARVTAPASAGNGQQSLYFRALSPTTGAQDIKHDAVQINTAPALSLTPDQIGQVMPGSHVLYVHQVTNTGSEPLSNVLLTGDPDAALDNGWSVVLFEDTDGNGDWGPADQPLPAGTPLATVGGDGILAVGESVTVFARVFAPANAAYGITNTKTISATAQGVTLSVSASAQDVSTVSNTQVRLSKEQALDQNCDGVPDGPGSCTGAGCFVYTRFQAVPGQHCVIYRVTALNNGGETMHQVTLNDRTQPFTSMLAAATDCQSPSGACTGAVVAPADYGTGDISVNVGELAAGETATLIFGLRVE